MQGDTSLNWGSILENAAAQSLVSNEYELYYYNSKSLGEIDFVIQKGTTVHLVEMKSSTGYRKHAALEKSAPSETGSSVSPMSSDLITSKKKRIFFTVPSMYLLPFLEKDPLPEFNFESLNIPD